MVTNLSLSLYGYKTTRDRNLRFKHVQIRKYSKERLKTYTVTKLIVFSEMKKKNLLTFGKLSTWSLFNSLYGYKRITLHVDKN
jgi:hypothetical protein